MAKENVSRHRMWQRSINNNEIKKKKKIISAKCQLSMNVAAVSVAANGVMAQ
jgi:hypothetical protein